MKTIYFIRHAKSSWADMSLKDFDRPLNDRGKRDAPFMAKKLVELGVQPDAIVSSPAKRAYTTAKHFAKAFDMSKSDILKVEAIYEAWGSEVMNVVQALPNGWNTVLIFGHNPSFTSIANGFEGGTDIDNVPTCGIVKVETVQKNWKDFKHKTGVVKAFYYPKKYMM